LNEFGKSIEVPDLLLPIKGSGTNLKTPSVVLFADSTTDRIYVMSLSKSGKPQELAYYQTVDELENNAIKKGVFSRSDYMKKPELYISKKQLEKRDKKFAVINPILKDIEGYVTSRNYGKKVVENCLEIAKKVGIKASRTQLYDWLYQYFRAGCHINGLLRKPGSGEGINKNYKKKTGPKRGDGLKPNGRMRNKEDEKNIRATLNKHVKCDSPKSLPGAYIEYRNQYASDEEFDSFTGEHIGYKKWDSNIRISRYQFFNYATEFKSGRIDEFRLAQLKTDDYNKNEKGLSGTIGESYGQGPAKDYQIDETPLSIELVDEFDPTRTKRMGRPTCYSVIDMFSRAWVGLLLTFAKASAHTAREIVFIAFRNKEKFCNEIGVVLHEPWVFEGKSHNIVVDNLEFATELTRAFSKDASINVTFNTEGNSQQKGLVERRHKSLEDFLYGRLPGVGRKNIADFLKRRLRKDALINIRELYQILIDFITRYNNYYPLKSLPITAEMKKDGVQKIPLSKWNWGMVHRAGFLKKCEEDDLYLDLLESGTVTVYQDHVFLPGKYIRINKNKKTSKGLKYTCTWVLGEKLQDLKNGALPILPCKFMRYSMSKIYIVTADGLQSAVLHEEDAIYEYMSAEAIQGDKNIQTVKDEELLEDYEDQQSKTLININKIAKNARSEQVKINPNQANTQDISANRDEAIEKEIAASQQQHSNLTNAEHVPIPQHDNPQENVTEDTTDEQSEIAQAFSEKSRKNKFSRSKQK
jgi:hypothetical protein